MWIALTELVSLMLYNTEDQDQGWILRIGRRGMKEKDH